MRLVFAIFFLLAFSGCHQKPVPAAPEVPATGKVVQDHQNKDRVLLKEADAIDKLAPQAKPHTDAQRKAVAEAPAEQIAKLAADFTEAIASYQAIIDAKDALLTKKDEQIKSFRDSELNAQVRTMRWFGFGCLLAAGALGYARQTGFAIAAGGTGFLSLGLAQLWHRVASHPAFLPSLGALVVLGVIAFVWAAVHAYKKGDLTTKALREKERLSETLRVIVPALDEAKQELGDVFNPVLTKLSSKMDWEDKQTVKRIRAEAVNE